MCRRKKKIDNIPVNGDYYYQNGAPDMGYDYGYGQPDMFSQGMIQLPPIIQPVIMMPFGMPLPPMNMPSGMDDDDDFDDFEDDF